MTEIHNKILKVGRSLGYILDSDLGVCNGFTFRWIEAWLLNEENKSGETTSEVDKFNQRVKRILVMADDEHLRNKVQAVKIKVKSHIALTIEEKNLMDVLAFYESMSVFQAPHQYSGLLNQYSIKQHDIIRTSPIVSSDRIIDRGGLMPAFSELGIYTRDEIFSILRQYEQTFAKFVPLPDVPVAFMLRNQNHAIGLIYSVQERYWQLQDINQDAGLLPKESFNTAEIADAIFQGFNHLLPSVRNIYFMIDGIENKMLKSLPYFWKSRYIARSTFTWNEKKFTFHYQVTTKKWRIIEGGNIGNWSQKNEFVQEIFYLLHKDKPQNETVTFAMTTVTTVQDEHRLNLKEQLNALKTPQILNQEILQRDGADYLAPIAAQMDRLDIIALLLNYGIDISDHQLSLLHIAAQYGDITLFELICRLPGNHIKHIARDGHLLYVAAENGHTAMVEKLIEEYDSHVDERMDDGATPMHVAAANGHNAIIKILKDEGADIDARTHDGATPILLAVSKGHTSVVKQLIKYGASTNINYVNNMTLMHVAASNGHGAIVEICAKWSSVNARMSDGSTPLLLAAANGHVAVVETAIRLGASINASMHNGITPIFIAAQNGEVDVVSLLLDRHADQDLSMISSCQELQTLVAQKGDDSVNKMNEFIRNKSRKVGSSEVIFITPQDIAHIMGHQDVAALLKSSASKVSCEKVLQDMQYLSITKTDHELTNFIIQKQSTISRLTERSDIRKVYEELTSILAQMSMLKKMIDDMRQSEKYSFFRNDSKSIKKSLCLLSVHDRVMLSNALAHNIVGEPDSPENYQEALRQLTKHQHSWQSNSDLNQQETKLWRLRK